MSEGIQRLAHAQLGGARHGAFVIPHVAPHEPFGARPFQTESRCPEISAPALARRPRGWDARGSGPDGFSCGPTRGPTDSCGPIEGVPHPGDACGACVRPPGRGQLSSISSETATLSVCPILQLLREGGTSSSPVLPLIGDAPSAIARIMDADTVDAVGQAAEVLVKTSNEFNVPGILLAIGDATGQPVNLVVFALTIATLFAFWVLTRCLGFGGGGGGSSNTGSSSGDCVLITGACGGGKTAMFQTLRSGEVFLDRTVTSMDVNEARIEVRSEKLGKSKRARLVDLPGHPRLRAKLDRYANGAKAIVFVVDAVDFTSQRRAVAEHLFEILSHPVVQKGAARS